MKKIITSIFLSIISIGIFAQTSSKKASAVKQEVKTMSQGVKNAFVVELPGVKVGTAEDRWKKLMESYKAKPKWNKKEKEYFSDNAAIVEINGNNPVDVYAKIEEAGTSNSLLTVWYDLGGAYLNTTDHSEKSAFGEKIVMQFAKDAVIAVSQEEVKDEEDRLKKQEKKMKNLVEDKEDLKKSIENYKAKIKKAEEDIIKNEQNQKDQQKAVEDQKEAVKKAQQRLDDASKA